MLKNLKINLFIIFILFINTNKIYSQHYWFAKTGINYSTLSNLEDIKPEVGYNFTFGREWVIYKSFSFSLGLEYTVRSFTLKNKAIGPVIYMGEYPWGKSVYNYDIAGKISFIEIPVYLKYRQPINNKWKMNIHFGCSKSYPINDFTKLNRKGYLFEYDSNLYDKIFRFKLTESTFPDYQSGYILNIGIEFIYQNYGLEIEYQKDMRDEIFLDSLLGIKGKVNSLRISLVFLI